MKVVFLDIDGVLNSRKYFLQQKEGHKIDPECVQLLNKITDNTSATIVISSSWRITYELQELKDIFVEVGIKGKVVGKTKVLDIWEYGPAPRGCEIQEYITRNKVQSYAILDDDPDMLYSQKDSFFQTDPETGLSKEVTNNIINHLK